ncbi:patatin-like phospholipase family protein [Micromonospora sp. H61]|uniref:patatin-like phospholipase family protein n=1 Tax=Micromonospora sp. H61 TaxID=2824888 RepID=UPI001B6F8CE3|nr:patatin-like phospholipase family protein [Micromonospora sp. H61]
MVVDTETGASRTITRHDGVPLVNAVAASCAMPTSAAPVSIGDRRYLDGGMRSTLNLDLAPETARPSPSHRAPPRSARGRVSTNSERRSERAAGWSCCSGIRPPNERRGPV